MASRDCGTANSQCVRQLRLGRQSIARPQPAFQDERLELIKDNVRGGAELDPLQESGLTIRPVPLAHSVVSDHSTSTDVSCLINRHGNTIDH